MNSRDFCYWLQGFFEVSGHKKFDLNGRQIEIIQNHLNLVFKHEIDPEINAQHIDYGASLNHIHEGMEITAPDGTVFTVGKKLDNIDWNVPDVEPTFKPWPRQPGVRC